MGGGGRVGDGRGKTSCVTVERGGSRGGGRRRAKWGEEKRKRERRITTSGGGGRGGGGIALGELCDGCGPLRGNEIGW